MDLFDKIIETLRNEQEIAGSTYISPTVLKSFYAKAQKAEEQISAGSPQKLRTPHNVEKEKQRCNPGQMNMEQLQNEVKNCTKCILYRSRKNTVFGEGSSNADLMIIGEGPGRDEDKQGRPFVGRSGQLLTKMLKAMGFEREEVFIANIVKCRPPNNRNPNPDEAAMCMPYLLKQIEIIQPKVLLLLGAVAMKFLLDQTGIMRKHGQWFEFKGIKTLPTFHPSFLLRDPRQKKHAWADLQKVMKVFGKL
jgi:DNA polymerase